MSNKDHPEVKASRAITPSFFKALVPEWNDIVADPYQHAAVEYRIGRRHCLIADAPGLGKTGEALLFGNAIQAKYTLCVVPASLRLNWEREIRMWSTIERVTTYPVLKAKDGVSLLHNFVIISYDLLRNSNILAALMDERWDHLILDEAHALKDPKGNKRTKAICGWMDGSNPVDGLADVSDRITLLTGTPMPNQPVEIYNAARLLDHSCIDHLSLDGFKNEYYEEGGGMVRGPVLITKDEYGEPCEPHYVSKLHFSAEVRNVPVNHDDLQYRLRRSIMVRRLKEDVLTQLPPKQWHPFPIVPNAKIKKVLSNPAWTKVERLYEIDPHAFDTGIPVDGAVSTAMRELGEAKAPIVADYIEDLLQSGVEKILVGAWHRNTVDGVGNTGLSVLHYLRKRLSKYGVAYMDGGTTPRRKQDEVDAFQNDPDIRVIIGQLATIGEGHTLTAAQDAVFAEFYWVPGKNDQLLDRLHRRGQEGGYVLGHIPVVEGSMDERVIGTAVEKSRHIHKALDA